MTTLSFESRLRGLELTTDTFHNRLRLLEEGLARLRALEYRLEELERVVAHARKVARDEA